MAVFKNAKLDYRGYGTVDIFDEVEGVEVRLCTIALHEGAISITSGQPEGSMQTKIGTDWPDTVIIKFNNAIKKV